MNGIINLYKPKGITSSDAVTKVKRILGTKTVGHMGTLDPAGEGVLLIGVGRAARLFNFYLKKDKLYEADFTFGYETDTLDGDGEIIRTSNVFPTINDIKQNLQKLVGKQLQMPPAYSAKNVGGVRAYALARQGKEVVLQPSAVEIYSVRLLCHCYEKNHTTGDCEDLQKSDGCKNFRNENHLITEDDKNCKNHEDNSFKNEDYLIAEEYSNCKNNVYKVLIHCSSGTYIRSVCRDLAALCGSTATMTAIKRLKSGEFKVENSINLEKLQLLKASALISLDDALMDLPKIEVDKEFKKKLDNGVRLTLNEIGLRTDIHLNAEFTLYCDAILYGIAEVVSEKIIIKTYLKD